MSENLHSDGFDARVRAGDDAPPAAGPGSDDLAADDEEALGAALGRAIGDRVDAAAPPAMPLMAEIEDMAMARARARTTRRAVVAVAASVAMVVGGVVGWNALDRDATTTLLVTAVDPPGPSTGPVPASGASGSVAPGGEPERQPEAATVLEDDSSSPSDPAATGGEGDEPAESDLLTPEAMSTGPVLQWTQIEPEFIDLFGLESVGDGRVVARAFRNVGEPGSVVADELVVVTVDGTNWVEVPMPDGVSPDHLDISGDRWVVAGRDTGSGSIGGTASRVFYSDDQATTWTELDISLPPDPAPASPWLVDETGVTSVLVSGENIVLVTSVHQDVDLEALVADRGLVPEGKTAVLTGWEGFDTVVLALLDSDAQSTPTSAVANAFDGSVPDEDILKLTYDELGLTDEERTVLEPSGEISVRLLWSDGSAVEPVFQYDGWGGSGVATAEGFAVTAFGMTGAVIATSPDGIVWSEERSSALGYGELVASGGTIWRSVSDLYGSFSVERSTLDQAPTTVATFDGLQSIGVLVAGPAGLVAGAVPALRDLPQVASGMPEGRVAKDGYELRYNEPEGGVTLWDLTEDGSVYVFGPEDMEAETPPEGVREIEDGQTFAVVFEDPETGADLVTFTDEDLAPVFGLSVEQLEAANGGAFEAPEQWVGWSADGTDWGWQTMVDAFDITDGEPWAQLAVGQDFVIARVEAGLVANTESISDGQSGTFGITFDAAPRWFLARVP